MLHYGHRFLAGFLGVGLLMLSIHASKRAPKDRALLKLAHGASALWLGQVIVGGLNVLSRSAPWAIILHVLLGSLIWATLVAFCVVAYKKAGRLSEGESTVLAVQRGAAATRPPIMDCWQLSGLWQC